MIASTLPGASARVSPSGLTMSELPPNEKVPEKKVPKKGAKKGASHAIPLLLAV